MYVNDTNNALLVILNETLRLLLSLVNTCKEIWRNQNFLPRSGSEKRVNTFKLAWGGFSQRAFSMVLVLGVEAADGAVLGRGREGAAVNHLSNQHSFLCEDDLRLLLGQRQVWLLIGYSTQLYHTVDNVSWNLSLDICTKYSQTLTFFFSGFYSILINNKRLSDCLLTRSCFWSCLPVFLFVKISQKGAECQ